MNITWENVVEVVAATVVGGILVWYVTTKWTSSATPAAQTGQAVNGLQGQTFSPYYGVTGKTYNTDTAQSLVGGGQILSPDMEGSTAPNAADQYQSLQSALAAYPTYSPEDLDESTQTGQSSYTSIGTAV